MTNFILDVLSEIWLILLIIIIIAVYFFMKGTQK